jgi:hypothetical protein
MSDVLRFTPAPPRRSPTMGPPAPSLVQCLDDLHLLARLQPESFHAVAKFVQQLTRGLRAHEARTPPPPQSVTRGDPA